MAQECSEIIHLLCVLGQKKLFFLGQVITQNLLGQETLIAGDLSAAKGETQEIGVGFPGLRIQCKVAFCLPGSAQCGGQWVNF